MILEKIIRKRRRRMNPPPPQKKIHLKTAAGFIAISNSSRKVTPTENSL